MRHIRNILFGAIGALLLPLVTGVGILHAQSDGRVLDTTFTFDRGGRVHLGLISGSIRVATGTVNEIRIRATTERGRLETSLSRSRVSIETRSVGGRVGTTRYELTVPIGTRVTASSISGDITIRGTQGSVEATSVSGDIVVEDGREIVDVRTVSGDLDLSRASGRIDGAAVSGNIRATDITGEGNFSGVSADITIRNSKLSRLRTETTSGDMSYDGTISASGDYRFNSHSGDVVFAIPEDLGAVLDLETFSGNISSAFPLTLQPGENTGRRPRRMQFTIGSGGARISAETFSGNITIRRVPARGNEE